MNRASPERKDCTSEILKNVAVEDSSDSESDAVEDN